LPLESGAIVEQERRCTLTEATQSTRRKQQEDEPWRTGHPHRVVASPPSATLMPWLGRAGHHPTKPNRNRRRRSLQLGHDPAPRAAPPRQGIKSSIPPARNLRASTRRRSAKTNHAMKGLASKREAFRVKRRRFRGRDETSGPIFRTDSATRSCVRRPTLVVIPVG